MKRILEDEHQIGYGQGSVPDLSLVLKKDEDDVQKTRSAL